MYIMMRLIIFLFLLPVFIFSQHLGFKDVPFGTKKEALIRRLVVKYGFRQVHINSYKNQTLENLEITGSGPKYYSKYEIMDICFDLIFYFDENESFYAFSFKNSSGNKRVIQKSAKILSKAFTKRFGRYNNKYSDLKNNKKKIIKFWSKNNNHALAAFCYADSKYSAVGKISIKPLNKNLILALQ